MACVDDTVQAFLEWCIKLDEVHPWRSNHDVTRSEVRHAKHAFEHETTFSTYHLVVFCV